MPKFRKKPVVVEAVQFGDSPDALRELKEFARRQDRDVTLVVTNPPFLTIKTLEGTMKANLGDWLIRGVKGELYPCKPDIFEATYQLVEERQE